MRVDGYGANLWQPTKPLPFTQIEQPPTPVSGDCSIINVFHLKTCKRDETMIHIHVPDTQVLVETDGVKKFTAFNIHINGWYHTAVRFSHLYLLSEFIHKKFPNKFIGPDFPPKKLLRLDPSQVEERRNKLSKYFNALVQNPDITRHPLIERKFLELQVNAFRATSTHVSVDIYLGDGEKVVVKCDVDTSTNNVMKKLAEKLNIVDTELFLWNFGLFVGKPMDGADKEDFRMKNVRFLQNFESPYVSVRTMDRNSASQGYFHKLLLRKLIWDPRVEEALLEDPIFTNLLVRQAMGDMNTRAFEVQRDSVKERLRSLERAGDQLQFLRVCHQQPTYSYEVLSDCESDHPRPHTKCSVKIGRRQIVLQHGDTESIFRATRIRVWRIIPSVNEHEDLIFQFEYLVGQQQENFEWITLKTDQAIYLSLLLQSVGAEILLEHRNMTIEQQLSTNGGGQGMSMFLEPSKTNLIRTTQPEGDIPRENPPPYRESEEAQPPKEPKLEEEQLQHQNLPRSAITRIEESSVSNSDPLGVGGLHDVDIFTTITDALPLHNAAFANITDDDL